MKTPGKLLALASLAIAAAGSGCIYQREVVREPVPVAQPAPRPPPPPPEEDTGAPPPPASAQQDEAPPAGTDIADYHIFYERLAPYGHWEWVPDYGRVWVPAVAVGWRPYVYGRWVLTDWGWTWVSDDPWGWAAYHYGSWGFTVGIGWFWLPGRIWAPAWVSWRYGYGYCAWAPIGPRGFVYGAYSPAWVAIREQHFTQPVSVHVVAVQQTGAIVQRAAPLQARPASRSGTFGPPVAHVASATGQAIRPVSAGSVVGPRAQPAAGRSSTPSAAPSASGRAQASPTQSPRAQPSTQSPAQSPRAGGWRSRNWSQDGTRTRNWSGASTARPGSWGAPRAGGSSGRPSAGSPSAGSPSAGSPSAGSGARAAPSGPSTSGGGAHAPAARGSASGSPGGGGHSSGGAHASGGHGHR